MTHQETTAEAVKGRVQTFWRSEDLHGHLQTSMMEVYRGTDL